MKRLIGMIQFLTRIPLPIDTGMDEAFHKGMVYFPIVGLVLGLFYGAVGAISSMIFNPYISSVFVLITTVILTGGLHLDGLGDSFDGLYSYRSKERILEIMKDSRLGTNALLAIVLTLLLKLGFIYTILEQGKVWPLVLMPVYARSLQVIACYKTKTPRSEGMGNLFIGKVSFPILAGMLSYLSLIVGATVYLDHGNYIGYFILFGILVLWVRQFIHRVTRQIDGITGDILGCICELAEVLYLIGIYFI